MRLKAQSCAKQENAKLRKFVQDALRYALAVFQPTLDQWKVKLEDLRADIQKLLQKRADIGAALSAPNPEEPRLEPLCLQDHCGSVVNDDSNTTLIWASTEYHRDIVELLWELDPASTEALLQPQKRRRGKSRITAESVLLLVEDLLPYLIRGEGDTFTEMVEDMLEQACGLLCRSFSPRLLRV